MTITAKPGDPLTRMEYAVAEILTVHTVAEVAAALYLSQNTVKSHKARVFRKLGINRRREIAAALGVAA